MAVLGSVSKWQTATYASTTHPHHRCRGVTMASPRGVGRSFRRRAAALLLVQLRPVQALDKEDYGLLNDDRTRGSAPAIAGRAHGHYAVPSLLGIVRKEESLGDRQSQFPRARGGRMPAAECSGCSTVWTVCILLVTRCPVLGQQSRCDAACQASQQTALVSVYTATGGAAWQPTSALIEEPAGWLNFTTTDDGLPSHCGWSGIQARI